VARPRKKVKQPRHLQELPPDLAGLRLLTVPEVAHILHIHSSTVYRLIGDGSLRKIQRKPGKRIRIAAAELTRYIEDNSILVVPGFPPEEVQQ